MKMLTVISFNAMTMIVRTAFVLYVIACAGATSNNVAVKSINHTPEIIMAAGYHSERHHVVTVDDYILEMHRIPFAKGQHSGPKDRPIVLLMHGLLGASNAYIVLGPDYSIAYNLADAGFDVWMGNARGTRNSRLHLTLDPDSRDDRHTFFDFTWEQIGMYDIAGMVDYILEFTGRQQLHYVGHSQGGTVFLVLTSTRPEYNQKFASVHLLAGVGYKNYFPHVLLRSLALFTNSIYNLAVSLGVVELFPPQRDIVGSDNTTGQTTGVDIINKEIINNCTGDVKLRDLCPLLGISDIIGGLEDLNLETGGAGLKQIAHYGQNIQDKQFRRWNYGREGNLIKYGSIDPPIYNLSLITAQVTMHYTVSDNLLDERDVLDMASDMPNTVTRKVARESFGHVDFMAANDVRELVTNFIIQSILDVEFPKNETIPEQIPEYTPTDASSTIVLSVMFKIYLITNSLYVLLVCC